MSEIRECPACAMPTDAALPECEVCGYEFPQEKAGVTAMTWLFIALMVLFAVPLLAWLSGWLG